MRIALLPDDYLPSSTLVHAKMFHELALQLKRLGHEPVIITPGLPDQHNKLMISTIDDIEVWRFRSGYTRGVGKIKRAINESFLSIKAWLAIKDVIKDNPFDLCINYSPTIFFGTLINLIKYQNKNCKSYLVLRDMFPQWIIDEGIISKYSPIAVYFRFFEKLNYRSSDAIGLMSIANVNYFNKLHPEFENIEVLHNWSELTVVPKLDEFVDIRVTYNLNDKVIFFYGGNIGHAQDMTNIMRLARSLLPYQESHILIVGQGDEFQLVQKLKHAWKLDNVTILPSVCQETYKQLLKQVDVGLFSLAKSHKAHNFPGKLLGYMRESLPILGSLNPGNDLVEFINDQRAGFAFYNGDDYSLSNAAIELLTSIESRTAMGANSYKVLTDFFSVETAANQILNSITKRS